MDNFICEIKNYEGKEYLKVYHPIIENWYLIKLDDIKFSLGIDELTINDIIKYIERYY